MRLLLGTTNPAKFSDFQLLLADLPLELITPETLGITETPKETGKTFEENARLKAKFYMEKSGLPALADDGGLEIDALDGKPGVLSRRWPLLKTGEDRDATDEEMIAYTLEAVKGLPQEERTAHMRVVVALAIPGKEVLVGSGDLVGYIPEKPLGKPSKNFPFREVLYIPQRHKYFGEFTKEEQKAHHARADALKPIKEFLKKYVGH